MHNVFTLLAIALALGNLAAQTTASFEEFELPANSFLNGSDGSGGFASGNVFLPNNYDEEFESWAGWSISTSTDTLTPGYFNQYSAIAGSGAEGSATFAVSSESFNFQGTVMRLQGDALGGVVEGFYITNTTYAYLSMLDGDAFAKKFGGETGEDPDFFLLTIKKYYNGQPGADSVNFYLADYRFENHAQDYIVREWTFVDLSSLGNADSLLFRLSSSDVGIFGMNTPAYFCVDNIVTADRMTTSARETPPLPDVRVFPNPAAEFLTVDCQGRRTSYLSLSDMNGRRLQEQAIYQGRNQIDLRRLPKGVYVLRLADMAGWKPRLVIKQ